MLGRSQWQVKRAALCLYTMPGGGKFTLERQSTQGSLSGVQALTSEVSES